MVTVARVEARNNPFQTVENGVNKRPPKQFDRDKQSGFVGEPCLRWGEPASQRPVSKKLKKLWCSEAIVMKHHRVCTSRSETKVGGVEI